jgi:glycogen debranching enzyme
VITPRRGKPVEVNALWYQALRSMAAFARALGRGASVYDDLAARALHGFERFWNDAQGCLFDVIDGPDGHDATVRPNQVIAVSLPDSPLPPERARAVLDVVAARLLTSHGLATLPHDDPAFRGSYAGDQEHRDSSYHQGTVWPWLIGPFVDALLRVHGDVDAAQRLLQPFADHIRTAGLGSISEICDGDAPHEPRGCIAQAWSVAEVLRAATRIEQTAARTRPGSTSTPPPEEPS